ncbi:MAG: phycobilisome linker polypeptide [Pleurocapsa sp.]
MTGMISTGDNNVSEYGSRTVAIEVTGVCRQELMRTSNYTVKVPYSRMSQTIQNISRMGGKVANISLNGTTSVVDAPTEEPEQTAPKRSNSKKNRSRK